MGPADTGEERLKVEDRRFILQGSALNRALPCFVNGESMKYANTHYNLIIHFLLAFSLQSSVFSLQSINRFHILRRINILEKTAVRIERFNLFFGNRQYPHVTIKSGDLEFVQQKQSFDGGQAVARIDRVQGLIPFGKFGDDHLIFGRLCSHVLNEIFVQVRHIAGADKGVVVFRIK